MRSYGICLSLTYSLSIMPSRSVHVVAIGKISLFFMAEYFFLFLGGMHFFSKVLIEDREMMRLP